MKPDEQFYRELIEERICSHCIDAGEGGMCHISIRQECAVQRFIPGIIEAIESVESPAMEPYENMLRRIVCESCAHQSSNGKCIVRDELDCALDRYFPLIVQVIEEARGRAR